MVANSRAVWTTRPVVTMLQQTAFASRMLKANAVIDAKLDISISMKITNLAALHAFAMAIPRNVSSVVDMLKVRIS